MDTDNCLKIIQAPSVRQKNQTAEIHNRQIRILQIGLWNQCVCREFLEPCYAGHQALRLAYSDISIGVERRVFDPVMTAVLRKDAGFFTARTGLPSPSAGGEVVAAVDAPAAHFAGETALRLAGFAFLKQRGVVVIEILQLHARDFLADEPFDGKHVAARPRRP